MQPEPVTPDDRLLAAVRAIIRAELAHLTFAGAWEYAIQKVTGEGADATIDAVPTSTEIPLPTVTDCPLAGVAGVTSTPVIGTTCAIIFLNADPSRPKCISFDAETDGVKIAGGADFVALASKVSDELDSIKSAFTSHTHAGVTAGPGSSGPPAVPPYTPGDVAASKTRAT